MKYKPEVKNELILENVLTLHNETEGQKVRVALQYGDMLVMKVHEPTDDNFKDVMLLFTPDDIEAIIKLYEEWKD